LPTEQTLQLVPNFLLVGVKGGCIYLVTRSSQYLSSGFTFERLYRRDAKHVNHHGIIRPAWRLESSGCRCWWRGYDDVGVMGAVHLTDAEFGKSVAVLDQEVVHVVDRDPHLLRQEAETLAHGLIALAFATLWRYSIAMIRDINDVARSLDTA